MTFREAWNLLMHRPAHARRLIPWDLEIEVRNRPEPLDATGGLCAVLAFYSGQLEDVTTEQELDDAVRAGALQVELGVLDLDAMTAEAWESAWVLPYLSEWLVVDD
jgi:hypothetical protein